MKIGLLPLFIKLYDDIGNADRPTLEPYIEKIAQKFEAKGFEVVRNGFCRIKPEFEEAVAKFESEKADVIVTVHMAYSPSLESIEVLTKTELPIVVLDTTYTPEYNHETHGGFITFNHGIHGVMDMCSMLKRYGKKYAIAAGHSDNSDVIDRVCGYVKAAASAKALSETRVARVGGSFAGMGDFLVPNEEMKERFGVVVDELKPDYLADMVSKVTDSEIDAEVKDNEEKFDFAGDLIEDEYREYLKCCLGMRNCLEDGSYNAFTVNFLQLDGIGTMPFLEACKAMGRGIGYAGEGDALTAAFTGALMKAYPETGFIEIFCPDWKNDMLLLSHMGEISYSTVKGKPVITRGSGSITKGIQPYKGFAGMKEGKGVYVNISRDVDNFQLFAADCEIVDRQPDEYKTTMHGWLKPTGYTISEFLELHSKHGATHHSIFVYGATKEEMEYFGKLLGMKVVLV